MFYLAKEDELRRWIDSMSGPTKHLCITTLRINMYKIFDMFRENTIGAHAETRNQYALFKSSVKKNKKGETELITFYHALYLGR
jgi:hypothetical protein